MALNGRHSLYGGVYIELLTSHWEDWLHLTETGRPLDRTELDTPAPDISASGPCTIPPLVRSKGGHTARFAKDQDFAGLRWGELGTAPGHSLLSIAFQGNYVRSCGGPGCGSSSRIHTKREIACNALRVTV